MPTGMEEDPIGADGVTLEMHFDLYARERTLNDEPDGTLCILCGACITDGTGEGHFHGQAHRRFHRLYGDKTEDELIANLDKVGRPLHRFSPTQSLAPATWSAAPPWMNTAPIRSARSAPSRMSNPYAGAPSSRALSAPHQAHRTFEQRLAALEEWARGHGFDQ